MDRSLHRRTCLRTAALAALGGVAGCLGGNDDGDGTPTPDATPSPDGTPDSGGPAGTPSTDEPIPDAVGLEPVVTGLELPLDFAVVPGTDLRYVATQPGVVHVLGPDGRRDDPLLDLTDAVARSGYEMGLLGIALHPEFSDDRRLFVRYSAPARPGTPEEYNHTFVLAEFAVNEDGTRADPDSERTVLEIPQPQPNHNAGDVRFGPDDYLYVATGDGGAGADRGTGHPEDWYDAVPGGNGQDTTEHLLGGILRIDVDADPTESPRPEGGDTDDLREDAGYAVPSDNPLVDREGHRDEYYAWGMRNPWRGTFDGDRHVVADVGQTDWESVYVVESGGNYGWNVKEGTHCFQAVDCPDETPEDVRGGEPLIDPVVEYPNRDATEETVDGVSIVGGHVYRGSAVPGLAGRYVFGDLETNGRLFVATPSGEGPAEPWDAEVLPLAGDAAEELTQLLAFGQDEDGEVYALGGEGVYRLTTA